MIQLNQSHQTYTEMGIRAATHGTRPALTDADAPDDWLKADALRHFKNTQQQLRLIHTLDWIVATSTLQSSVRKPIDEREVPKIFTEEHRYGFYLMPFFDATGESGQRYTTSLYYSPPCARAKKRAAKVLVYGYAVHEEELRNTVYLIICDSAERLHVVTDDFMYQRVDGATFIDIDYDKLRYTQEDSPRYDIDYAKLADKISEKLGVNLSEQLERLISRVDFNRPPKMHKKGHSQALHTTLSSNRTEHAVDAQDNAQKQTAVEADAGASMSAQQAVTEQPVAKGTTVSAKRATPDELKNLLLSRAALVLGS